MSNRIYSCSKEQLKHISFNEDEGILTISWDKQGIENAVVGIKLKVELVDKIISNYKAPKDNYRSDYADW